MYDPAYILTCIHRPQVTSALRSNKLAEMCMKKDTDTTNSTQLMHSGIKVRRITRMCITPSIFFLLWLIPSLDGGDFGGQIMHILILYEV